MCTLPKPPAGRALSEGKEAPQAAFPSWCFPAQTKRRTEGIRVPVPLAWGGSSTARVLLRLCPESACQTGPSLELSSRLEAGGCAVRASPVRLGSLAQPQRRGTSPSSVSSGQYFGPRFGAQCPERGREEAGCRRVLASLYWEGPSELPHRRSSSSAPRRDSTEPRPRGCSVPGEPPQALPSF